MKIGGDYKLSHIALRQWQKFARETRVDADEFIEALTLMAGELPDRVNDARAQALKEGLDAGIVERLAAQLVERATECRRLLGGG